LLIAWSVVTVIGVIAGFVWRWFPPHRVVAFAFCLPLLAAIGLGVLRERLPRLATPIAVVVVGAIAVSAVVLWTRAPRPYTDPASDAVVAVAPTVANTPGTVVVNLPAARHATAVAVIRSLNLLRAAVPGDRVRDVRIRYPAPIDADADATSLWEANEDAALGALTGGSATEVTAPGGPTPAPPLSVGAAFLAMLAWLGACGVAGAGWCVTAGHRGVALLERATGTGLAGLILTAGIADRLGLRLASRPVAVGVVAATAGAGYLAAAGSRAIRSRRGRTLPGATTTRATHGSLPSSIAPSLP
jgi:hypothetical protein